MSSKPIHVSLAVFRAGTGGNTRDGQYFYSFTPSIIDVSEPDTEVIFKFSEETPLSFTMADIYANDVSSAISQRKISGDKRSLSIVNANKVHQLIFLSLLVFDGEIRVNCDPQMTNTPKV